MSDDSNNTNPTTGGGRSLGGASEPLPTSWGSRPQTSRIGRVGSGGGRGGESAPQKDDDDDDEGDDPEKRESWFAGGEKSGLSVQNPNRQPQVPGGNVVRDILRRAAQPSSRPVAPTSSSFTGGGHKLGGEDTESVYVPDRNAGEELTQTRQLTFWRDGFTIGDGDLMRYDDPENAEILKAFHAGVAPTSLLGVTTDQPVDLRIERRLNEDYVPPAVKAFAGTGNRLGAPVPTAVPQSAMPGSFLTASSSSSGGGVPPPRESITTRFEVDQTLPTTSVQIRLADGTRMVCRMNLTHTVQDLRNFINASRPENSARPYTIGTTFPNRVLEDSSATVEGAGLLNSVVVQRWV